MEIGRFETLDRDIELPAALPIIMSFDELLIMPIIHLSLDKFFDFLHETRKRRNIGLSTSIDVIRYLIAGMISMKKEPWTLLDESLTDYILPQLDRLEIETLRHIFGAAQNIFAGGEDEPHCTVFISKLDDMIKNLGQMDKLFKISYE